MLRCDIRWGAMGTFRARLLVFFIIVAVQGSSRSEKVPTNPYTFSGAVTGEEYAALRLGEFAAASFHTAQQLNDQGVSLKAGGRYSEADTVLTKAVEIKKGLLGPSHSLLAVSLMQLAENCLSWGGSLGIEGRDKLERGRELAQQAMYIRRQTGDPKEKESHQLLIEINTALTAVTPPRQSKESDNNVPSDTELMVLLPQEAQLLRDGELVRQQLNKSRRWHHFVMRLVEEWLHVQVAEEDRPRVFGIQAVRIVSLLSEEPKVSLYVKHHRSTCPTGRSSPGRDPGQRKQGIVKKGRTADDRQGAWEAERARCTREWPALAGPDLKPSDFENFDGGGGRDAGERKVLTESPKDTHKGALPRVWYHSAELTPAQGNLGFLGVRLGTRSPGEPTYTLRTHLEPLIPLEEGGGGSKEFPVQQTWVLEPLRVNYHYLKLQGRAEVSVVVRWPLQMKEECALPSPPPSCTPKDVNPADMASALPSLRVLCGWDTIPVVDRRSISQSDPFISHTVTLSDPLPPLASPGAGSKPPSKAVAMGQQVLVEHSVTVYVPAATAAPPGEVLYIGLLSTRGADDLTYNITVSQSSPIGKLAGASDSGGVQREQAGQSSQAGGSTLPNLGAAGSGPGEEVGAGGRGAGGRGGGGGGGRARSVLDDDDEEERIMTRSPSGAQAVKVDKGPAAAESSPAAATEGASSEGGEVRGEGEPRAEGEDEPFPKVAMLTGAMLAVVLMAGAIATLDRTPPARAPPPHPGKPTGLTSPSPKGATGRGSPAAQKAAPSYGVATPLVRLVRCLKALGGLRGTRGAPTLPPSSARSPAPSHTNLNTPNGRRPPPSPKRDAGSAGKPAGGQGGLYRRHRPEALDVGSISKPCAGGRLSPSGGPSPPQSPQSQGLPPPSPTGSKSGAKTTRRRSRSKHGSTSPSSSLDHDPTDFPSGPSPSASSTQFASSALPPLPPGRPPAAGAAAATGTGTGSSTAGAGAAPSGTRSTDCTPPHSPGSGAQHMSAPPTPSRPPGPEQPTKSVPSTPTTARPPEARRSLERPALPPSPAAGMATNSSDFIDSLHAFFQDNPPVPPGAPPGAQETGGAPSQGGPPSPSAPHSPRPASHSASAAVPDATTEAVRAAMAGARAGPPIPAPAGGTPTRRRIFPGGGGSGAASPPGGAAAPEAPAGAAGGGEEDGAAAEVLGLEGLATGLTEEALRAALERPAPLPAPPPPAEPAEGEPSASPEAARCDATGSPSSAYGLPSAPWELSPASSLLGGPLGGGAAVDLLDGFAAAGGTGAAAAAKAAPPSRALEGAAGAGEGAAAGGRAGPPSPRPSAGGPVPRSGPGGKVPACPPGFENRSGGRAAGAMGLAGGLGAGAGWGRQGGPSGGLMGQGSLPSPTGGGPGNVGWGSQGGPVSPGGGRSNNIWGAPSSASAASTWDIGGAGRGRGDQRMGGMGGIAGGSPNRSGGLSDWMGMHGGDGLWSGHRGGAGGPSPRGSYGAGWSGGGRHDDKLCCVCLDAPREYAFTPCGHRCVCGACAHKTMMSDVAALCPVCRITVQGTLRIYD